MRDDQWEVVIEVAGALQAELIRGLLEAQQIEVVLSQEGIGHVYATTVGAFGRVQLLVPVKDVPRAKEILNHYYSDQPVDDQQESDKISGDSSN